MHNTDDHSDEIVTTKSSGQIIFENICALLTKNQINYRTVHHEATFTSEESAKARNEDLSLGGKAIIMKIDERFELFVLSASKKTDSKKIKEHFKAKKIRFATTEELLNLTGLVPGSVPPFGLPILTINLHLDNSILENEKIAFNAGLLTDSIIMNVNDYIAVAKPNIFNFASQ